MRDIEIYRKFKEKAMTLVKPNGRILAWGGDYMDWLLNSGGRKQNMKFY